MEEPKQVGELMRQLQLPKGETFTADTAIAWMDTELTEEETKGVILEAKRQKYIREQREKAIREREAYEEYVRKPWTVKELREFVFYRAKNHLKTDLVIDEANEWIFQTLCLYFSDDPDFESRGKEQGHEWNLNKGLLLFGDVGVGKTLFMKLFSLNKKACFDVINSVDLAMMYVRDGDHVIKSFSQNRFEPKDARYFYQQEIGNCFDDFGSEDDKNHFGNKMNVMANIILARYANKFQFPFDKTHITTNLSRTDIEKQYGTRCWDRMKEMFNVIQFKGKSRRI